MSVLGNSVEDAMRIAYLAAVAALTLAIGIPASSNSKPLQKIPPEGSGFPKVQACTAHCDWAFDKCVKKVQGTLNKAESPGYTDKQKQELTNCTSAKFACLVKRNCPVGNPDCTKLKTC
jgi:hypothetical protein